MRPIYTIKRFHQRIQVVKLVIPVQLKRVPVLLPNIY